MSDPFFHHLSVFVELTKMSDPYHHRLGRESNLINKKGTPDVTAIHSSMSVELDALDPFTGAE